MKYLTLLIFPLLIECGGNLPPKRLAPFIETFRKIFERETGKVFLYPEKYYLHDINDGSVVGKCGYEVHNRVKCLFLEIDLEYFNNSDYYTNLELVFHELGHGNLARDHCNGYRNDPPGPISLMYSFTMSYGTFEKYYDYYEYELFYNLCED